MNHTDCLQKSRPYLGLRINKTFAIDVIESGDVPVFNLICHRRRLNPCQEVLQHRNDDGLLMNFILSNAAHRCLMIGWCRYITRHGFIQALSLILQINLLGKLLLCVKGDLCSEIFHKNVCSIWIFFF